MQQFRIVTYNTHRSRGIDGRARPGRIAEVLSEIGADIVALQEVLSRAGASREFDQARYIAETLRMHWVMGVNRPYRGGLFGNVVLSRFPIRMMRNHDLSLIGREERGCLRADIDLGPRILHIFNVHLGTAVEERRYQGRKLITADLLNDVELSAPRIVLGDFNEWTRGVATRLLSTELVSADVEGPQHTRTFPGLLPVLHLDHIYYDPGLKLERLELHRSRKALIASDHLPLVADFGVPAQWGENRNGSK